MVRETPKILGVEVPVDVTCVRVPVQIGHAEAIVVETERPATPAEAARVLAAGPGILLADTPEAGTPARVAGTHEVVVGRIRGTRSFESGLQLWVAADNLLKGAAWNAVQIAEELLQRAPASTAGTSS